MDQSRFNNIDMESLRIEILKDLYKGKEIPETLLNFLDLDIYQNPKNSLFKLNRGFRQSFLNSEITLTQEQLFCLNTLQFDNLFISAPTSFGKTYIALEHIARNSSEFFNIVFVVPTIALMNELRYKCHKYFGEYFFIITSEPELKEFEKHEKKIIIVVPERINTEVFNEYLDHNEIDFLVYDEIYKLGVNKRNQNIDNRIIQMNIIYKYLISISKRILLLGPFIKSVEFENSGINIKKFMTNLNLVYNEILYEPDLEKYYNSNFGNQKCFIYFYSPGNIRKFLQKDNLNIQWCSDYLDEDISNWISENIHPDWYYLNYLQKGVGIHHGKTPLFLRKFIEEEYKHGTIHTILCTSTLMEGVNTPTDLLLIYDNPGGVFELNNLMGRVGRLNTDSPVKGSIIIKDKEVFEMTKLSAYIDLEILYETKSIETETPIDEALYLDKDLPDEQDLLLSKLETDIFDLWEIDINLFFEKGVEFSILRKFVDNHDVINIKQEKQIIYKLNNIIAHYNYLSGLSMKKYSFCGKYDEKYLNLDPVRFLLMSTMNMRDIVNKFEDEYTEADVSDINIFIDALFDVDEYIKFQLTKIIPIYEVLKENFILDSFENTAFFQVVGSIISYSNPSDGYVRVLYDLGFPTEDIRLIAERFQEYDFKFKTEEKLIMISEEIIFESLSPFGKRVINSFIKSRE